MHSSGMRTTHSLPIHGVSMTETPLGRDPLWTETPQTETPPDGNPLQEGDPPGQRLRIPSVDRQTPVKT